ncbi:signal peptidase I [Candidatus Nomurabacteria bacterium RIFCSPHIGHO2_12_FULL_37_29]|uniref:Signal peptidase I n=2 Tax=Candidatus Nomuraibacteriota TaxID=1752729 RepID=A0A1F6Y652_9BACT|nr:MAG: signal peptidase I [Candidatus Nomurabacteria bacterium RIFCSPHIGHO2_01_FULL_37_110]OGI79410.1 MAG: signal peptidase I [Candidatus Nomurabacteria bacterium RIFCSPHIGHO2_12_FULL_37_29]OGI84893.1 MAG: signal peptidase I [Candidatus Nomurabacteria bacterium RIFCSPLOWO2_01_FULL_37_49]OGJ01843.1 MAG: signal peptidase I [Candidatus Nomurabacteria bacterium RIFCSPLOWO2_12_FULL_37_8]
MKEELDKKLQEKTQEKTGAQSFWELVRFAVMALIIVIPIRVFLAEPFVVSGSSMVPTFEDGNYLIIDKISYRLNDPKRDDVIIFRYPNDQTKFFIKRIIGLPNETVDIKGDVVIITNGEHKDGLKLSEPYVKNIANNILHFELKSDEYFVMGDNRSGSSDSRYWGGVKRNLITGKAFLRLLPVKKIDILPGDYKQIE